MRRFLIDENLSRIYQTQLLDYGQSLTVLMIGDAGAPERGTQDPEILDWCEQNGFILITNNRKSMPQHLKHHLAAGNHVPGIFTISRKVEPKRIVEELMIIIGASDEEEYIDKITYIPL